MKKQIILIGFIMVATCLASCNKKQEANQKPAADREGKVLATVNDAPISEDDMKLRLQKAVTGGDINHEVSQNTLQNLVRDELIYQKGMQLGLDKRAEYRAKLNEVEAQFRAIQRQEMSALYRKYVQEKAEVTETDAQKYFEKNAKQFQTKYHLFQIFYKGKDKYPEIAKDQQDLKNGMSFEKVASRRFAGLPKNMTPWDLGFMYWIQMPQPWHGIVDRLEPGQATDIIKGDNDRFWLIKLVSKTVDPKVTYATEKENLVNVLRQQKADELYKSSLKEMQDKAKIVYTK